LTGNTRWPAADLRQHQTSHLVDHGFVRVTSDQCPLLLLDPDLARRTSSQSRQLPSLPLLLTFR
jgi:hypothetical protein